MHECLYLSNIYEDGALLLFTLKQSVILNSEHLPRWHIFLNHTLKQHKTFEPEQEEVETLSCHYLTTIYSLLGEQF